MSLAQEATRALGGDWHGRYGLAPSPGHGASDRGLSIRDSSDGRDVLVNSFNGADWREVKDAIRAAGVPLPEWQERGEEERETGLYEFADADGAILYRTRRLERSGERKRFVAERRDDRGRWIAGLEGVPRVLYRLPELSTEISKAALSDQPMPLVYLTEGERKADKLAAWGMLATACAFGARGWKRDYAATLAGCTVIILPDNDDEGRGFAAKAAESIREAGGKPFIVELPDLPPKGDVIDWRGSADDLRALTLAALHTPAAAPKLLPLIDPAVWHGAETPQREWAWVDWIPARQTTYLTGPGSAGKSLFGQQLATSTAIGRVFMGVEAREAVAVYVTCEDDGDELHRRQKAICAAAGIPLRALGGKLHLVSLAGAIGNELATFAPDGRMASTEAFATLRTTVQAVDAGLLILDNVAHLFAGNENIRNQVAAFIALLNGLAQEAGCAILLLGHPNKAGDAFSGSTAWENQVRSRLFLETPRDPAGGILDRDARTLSRGKANYARNGEAISFRWHQGAFVREDDLPPDMAAEIAANVIASADNATFLACLAKATEEKRATSASRSASNYAPRVFARMTTGKGVSEQRFEAALERLLHLGEIVGDQRVYQRENRTWALGLACTNPCTNPAQSDAQTLHEAAQSPSTDLHTHRTLGTTYLNGAAAEATAPFLEEEAGERMPPPVFAAEPSPRTRARTGPILAPDDIADGGTGGLEAWT